MVHRARRGRIEIIAGVMFSGKTDELIRRVRRAIIARDRVRVFTSRLDDRYAAQSVTSHDGNATDAVPIQSAADIVRGTSRLIQVVAVDEAQFLDEGIVEVATALAQCGVRVILAGTDTDFRGEPFGSMPALMAIAESVDKLHAVCVRCGDPACRNQRLVNGRPADYDSPTILVGGRETYEARCRACHDVPGVDVYQHLLSLDG
ncbi:MAG TPA: thymidine kinase [Gemmatimonadales bacterium]